MRVHYAGVPEIRKDAVKTEVWYMCFRIETATNVGECIKGIHLAMPSQLEKILAILLKTKIPACGTNRY